MFARVCECTNCTYKWIQEVPRDGTKKKIVCPACGVFNTALPKRTLVVEFASENVVKVEARKDIGFGNPYRNIDNEAEERIAAVEDIMNRDL
jgi:hypothetical protein